MRISAREDHTRHDRIVCLSNLLLRDEHIEPSRHDQTDERAQNDDVHKSKARDGKRVHAARGIEVGISERKDDRNDWRRVVLQDETPDGRNLPLAIGANAGVEISTKLVAL